MWVFSSTTSRLYGGMIVPDGMMVCGPPGVSSSILQPLTSSGVLPQLTISTHSGPLAGASMNSLISATGGSAVYAGPVTNIHSIARIVRIRSDRRITPPAANTEPESMVPQVRRSQKMDNCPCRGWLFGVWTTVRQSPGGAESVDVTFSGVVSS
jgi:hypothetical protein